MNWFKTLRIPMLAVFGLNLIGCGINKDPSLQHVVLDRSYYSDLYGWNEDKGLSRSFLGRGLNMGNFLDSPNYEGEWNGDLKIQSSDFKNISQSGFASVRIPVRWSAHTMAHDPLIIKEDFLSRVQEVVDQAIEQELRVVLNTHHFDELYYDQKNYLLHRQRLLSFWDQLSKRFPLEKYGEDKLVFELLNEPRANVNVTKWNRIVADLTDTLWVQNAETQNNTLGQRKVMIGTADWGGPFKLPDLVLPSLSNSSNTIITVHFYEPFKFTHQGAEWTEGGADWIGTRWLGTSKEQQVLVDYLDAVSRWNKQPNRGFEVNIGEFGVYSKHSLPQDQKAWTAFVARQAERRGFSWHYWEYSSGFGAYDPHTKQWRTPLLQGLIPSDLP